LLESEIHWPHRVISLGDAVRFINAAGYCLLFPVQNVPLPSLYYAMARRSPITWDKHCKKLWNWKDQVGRRRRAFYAKYFKGRGTFISLELLSCFLALEGSAVRPDDYERQYAAGQISHDARTIWQALEQHGPFATLELRHACQMDTKAGNARFKRAMLELQRRLLVVHSGTEQETKAWASGRFDLICHAFPEQVKAAISLSPDEARSMVARRYLRWHPNASVATLCRLFRWSRGEASAAIN
jgi:Winged helix DNA-binding domain